MFGVRVRREYTRVLFVSPKIENSGFKINIKYI